LFRPLLPLLLLLITPDVIRAESPSLVHDVLPLVKVRCVKCHGPGKAEGGLNLSTPAFIAQGGDSGAAVAGGKLDASLLWQRVAADEMPPDAPLNAAERGLLAAWIEAGAPGLPADGSSHPSGDHWAFVPLAAARTPQVNAAERVQNDVDRFLLAELERHGLTYRPEADRATLARRVAFDLTGLPPTPEEIAAYQNDNSADAYERMVDRYLATPHYGERWGKFWLDAAGYADSNGYFNADSDRPLAYRYRDYVVRAFNQDKPFDRFVIEQLAGDELAGYQPGEATTSEVISLLEATHYLRNGQDGTGESDGNDNEQTIDRYSALDSCLQIVSSSLLGLTVQCAKCHDHKFEPLSQRDYYQWQSVFYPAFNVNNWAKPNQRVVQATLPGELEAWKAHEAEIDQHASQLREEFASWAKDNQPQGAELFRDEFAAGGPLLADAWSNAAPGDSEPAGQPAINLDSDVRPGTVARDGSLFVLESGDGGDRVMSTRQAFNWSPQVEGAWIQVTFDMVDVRVGDSKVCERIAYYLAVRDFNDTREGETGNVLLEGKPEAGGAGLYLDYPGNDHKDDGTLGQAVYQAGHNYGVRVTRVADGKCRLDHLYDGVPDGKPATVDAEALGTGGFGFGLCCGRSFIVDNVVIAESQAENLVADHQRQAELEKRRNELAAAIKGLDAERTAEPGRIAWMTDRSPEPPEVHLLERGNHGTPGDLVEPAPLAALDDPHAIWRVEKPASGAETTGRRLAWARWVTDADARPAALMARVQMNRLWQQHFGAGIVATCENLGVSGAAPSHPELLEYLAGQFVRSGWSVKHMHRLMLASAAYRQRGDFDEAASKRDPDNRLLWRWKVRRLDAEAIRDAILATAGQLDASMGGPYVPTSRDGAGEVVVNAGAEGANRRSLYLQQRRSQTLSLLGVFDSPALVVNCVERPVSTIPLQSLSLLNSPFLRDQAECFARRIKREAGDDSAGRIERSFLLAYGREPTSAECAAAGAFLDEQLKTYAENEQRDQLAWTDYCQMLFASSGFLYVE
jgi:hypothetical protein